jgi:hypothetical protein
VDSRGIPHLQIWGTRHSLRIEIALPDHRLSRGVCEKFRLAEQALDECDLC